MKSIDQFNFSGKKVLIRVDYNVPLNEQFEVKDVTRIERTVETVNKIMNDGGSVILMSHLGRPKGETDEKYSLKHIRSKLSEILQKEVIFLGDILSDQAEAKAKALKPGEIALLENLRFHKEEEEGDVDFAKTIARLGDAYVNDAFGTAHREHASTATIARFFKGNCYAGHLLYEEVENLEKVLSNSKCPFTAIIGGAKVSTKINILRNLVDKVDSLIIAGGMSYTFMSAMGIKIGSSLFEPDRVGVAKEIIKKAHRKGVDLYFPIDNICANEFSNDSDTQITTNNDIADGWEGLDIGPRSIRKYTGIINQSRTILWNGPIGVFEFDKFGRGTHALAIAVASATLSGAYSLVGGGDTIAAVGKYGLSGFMSYISTGGGAMLEYLEGMELPGIKALNDNE